MSKRTSSAADEITGNTQSLSRWFAALEDETQSITEDASYLTGRAAKTDTALNQIAEGIHHSHANGHEILQVAERVQAAAEAFMPSFDSIARSFDETSGGISQSRERVNALVDGGERMLQGLARLGATTDDTPYIERVCTDAETISTLLEEAISAGKIREQDLFAQSYRPVPGTGPEQLMAPFTELTDALFPDVQEAALGFRPNVVFCAAVDVNGYLPTHNRAFSEPQGDDPVWNAAHSRNRRMFNDRVGLKAGRNTEPFLLQVYRRDMGGGAFKMMKDLSAPIMVRGRHWGGLRLAYAF